MGRGKTRIPRSSSKRGYNVPTLEHNLDLSKLRALVKDYINVAEFDDSSQKGQKTFLEKEKMLVRPLFPALFSKAFFLKFI